VPDFGPLGRLFGLSAAFTFLFGLSVDALDVAVLLQT
jgi:hypothetical protein